MYLKLIIVVIETKSKILTRVGANEINDSRSSELQVKESEREDTGGTVTL